MKSLLFLGRAPFALRVQLLNFWRLDRFDAIDVIIGVEHDPLDHGPFWRLMVGNLELRYWLGAWTDPRTRERYGSGRAK